MNLLLAVAKTAATTRKTGLLTGALKGGGSREPAELFGIKLIGISAENGHKFVLTIVFIAAIVLASFVLRMVIRALLGGDRMFRVRFWTRQGLNLFLALVGLLGFLSIWFDDPTRLATGFGLASAGLAFALQKVVTSLAGYFVILRGNNFTVGDRISMGGVRGDVIALGFIQTTIMEMGQPPAVQGADPAIWIKSRQFTGRIVTVSNSKIFDEPIYNYTREFPFIFEEMTLPIAYRDDRAKAEQILLDAAGKYTVNLSELDHNAAARISQKYGVMSADFEPYVYWRLTDNWLEMTVRFITKDHGVRDVKDAMSREVLAELDKAGIGLASGTYEIVGLPPIRVKLEGDATTGP